MSNGSIVQCIGAVVDIQFPRDQMPNIYEALKLTDCENRLKQTELHLQGELNRVRRRISIELYICLGCC